ncbi:MAG: hypothetical protein ACRDPH_04030 [Marmoricola sp.]
MQTTLDISTQATHEVLRSRLEAALASHRVAHRSRGDFPHTDTFLASISRHLAAVDAVLLPKAHRLLEDGGVRCHEFVHQSRLLEEALCQVKAKLYGEAHAIHRSWAEVWADVVTEFDATLALERRLVDDLLGRLGPQELDWLASRIYRSERHSPTRPHPFLPHQGLGGRLARRVAAPVDHFWDGTEGRMVPEPVHPPHHNGLMAHYIIGDPDPAPDEE